MSFDVQQILREALAHHQAGRLQQAEPLYRRALQLQPNNADALHLFGVLALQAGQPQAALQLISSAVSIKPTTAVFQLHLADAFVACGQADAAIKAYREAIRLTPRLIEAHHKLGNLFKQTGNLREAEKCYREVIRIDSKIPEAHYNLGDTLNLIGEHVAAAAEMRAVIVLRPQLAEAHAGLGFALAARKKYEEAIPPYQKAIALKPNVAEFHNNLGNALTKHGLLDEAKNEFMLALRINPAVPEMHNNLGDVLREQRWLDEAAAAIGVAIALKPDYAKAYINLAFVLCEQRRPQEAIAACKKAMELRPDLLEAQVNLATALRDLGRLQESIDTCRDVLRRKPDFAIAHSNLGIALQEQGHLTEAMEAFETALSLDSEVVRDFPRVHSNLLLCMHYSTKYDPQAIFQQHLRWAKQHAEPLSRQIAPHTNSRDPNRKLRIAYVSPDFRRQSVSFFFEPLLMNHDKSQIETFIYADELHSDETTARLQLQSAHWRNISSVGDAKLAEMVRADAIDIFVDLVGHTAHNRLLAFARKPAPVQVTYVGYPDTTGMSTMDYRLTDANADPLGMTESLHTEQLVRLPNCAWCYLPPQESLALEPRPREASDVVFGCFNILSKITPEVIAAWARLMQEVPGSKLMLKSRSIEDPREVRGRFVDLGIDSSRLDLRGREPSYVAHLKLYGQMDIVLDPWPYHGTTTTCEALWMGCPVVTLAGKTHVSRVGVSLLKAVGVDELIANDVEDYLRITKELALDRARSGELKMSLRERMRSSVLMDEITFTRGVEDAYRKMWRDWCTKA